MNYAKGFDQSGSSQSALSFPDPFNRHVREKCMKTIVPYALE
ncbi:MAG: hypothetical protein V8R52_14025 [Coprobacter fastidiosus]